MTQTFEYPNLLTGSRSGVGWTYWNGHMDDNQHHLLYNSTNKENFIYSPMTILKHGITYAFSVYTANTENCAGLDIFVLYEKTVTGWIAKHVTGTAKGPGGGGSLLRSRSPMPLRKGTTTSDSTTTVQQTGRMRSSGSPTLCFALHQNHTHGLRKKGRCGRK